VFAGQDVHRVDPDCRYEPDGQTALSITGVAVDVAVVVKFACIETKVTVGVFVLLVLDVELPL
jgi:hypothetical protein